MMRKGIWMLRGSFPERNNKMKTSLKLKKEVGKIGWALLWLIGVPIPILLILFALRGCT